jgi:hypothetical protein
VWCGIKSQMAGVKSADQVDCVTKEPTGSGMATLAALQMPNPHGMEPGEGGTATDAGGNTMKIPANSYKKFTSQDELGHFLESQYHIRTPYELSSCETCHR